MMIINKLIKRFARQMQIEVDNNKHKTGGIEHWKGIENKVADLEYHKAKMMLAIRTGDKLALKEYIADCANILMSIGHEYGLYDEPTAKLSTKSVVKKQVFDRISVTDLSVGKFSENMKDKIPVYNY